MIAILGLCLASTFSSPPATLAQEEQREWWYWSLGACIHQAEGDWSATAENWERAMELQPGLLRGWYELGAARLEAGHEGVEAALEKAAELADTRAEAQLDLLRFYAARGDDERAEAASRAALDAGLHASQSELRSCRELRNVKQEPWYRDFEKSVSQEPLERVRSLADLEDHDGLGDLFRSLSFRWRGDESAPAYLVQTLLDEAVQLAGRASATEKHEQAVARAAPVVSVPP